MSRTNFSIINIADIDGTLLSVRINTNINSIPNNTPSPEKYTFYTLFKNCNIFLSKNEQHKINPFLNNLPSNSIRQLIYSLHQPALITRIDYISNPAHLFKTLSKVKNPELISLESNESIILYLGNNKPSWGIVNTRIIELKKHHFNMADQIYRLLGNKTKYRRTRGRALSERTYFGLCTCKNPLCQDKLYIPFKEGNSYKHWKSTCEICGWPLSDKNLKFARKFKNILSRNFSTEWKSVHYTKETLDKFKKKYTTIHYRCYVDIVSITYKNTQKVHIKPFLEKINLIIRTPNLIQDMKQFLVENPMFDEKHEIENEIELELFYSTKKDFTHKLKAGFQFLFDNW